MTSGPDTLLPVALDSTLPSADLAALVAEAQAFVQRAKADRTRTTYQTAWQRYGAWCGDHGLDPLSPDPRQLVLFVTELARVLKTASIRTYLSGVAHYLRQAGVPVDLQHKAIVEVLAGVARLKGTQPRKVAPLLPETMRVVLAALPATPRCVVPRSPRWTSAMSRSRAAAFSSRFAGARPTQPGAAPSCRWWPSGTARCVPAKRCCAGSSTATTTLAHSMCRRP